MDPTSSSPPPDSLIRPSEGRQYWEGVSADVTGMLGGYPHLSKIDLQTSRAFLAKLGIGRENTASSDARGSDRSTRAGAKPTNTAAGGQVPSLRMVDRALEGGAGIGRVTLPLLTTVARTVDVIEPTARFTDTHLAGKPGIGRVFNVGLEEWQPQEIAVKSAPVPGEATGECVEIKANTESEIYHYDLVWTQWCVGHLTDDNLVTYFQRCARALEPTKGVMVLKENLVAGVGESVFDARDSSVTRSDETFRKIFERAGLRVIKAEKQHGFPRELYMVMTYALKPK